MAKKLSRAIGTGKKYISIPLYYQIQQGEYDNLQFKILSKEEGEKALTNGDNSVEVLNTRWRPHSWQTSNILVQSSLSYNQQNGQEEFDVIKYQDNLFKQCLVEWDLTDEDNNPIPVTPEALDDMPPEIAKALIKIYDKVNVIDQELQKK